MSMMSQTLEFDDSSKTQKSLYLENKKLLFIQIKN